MTRQRNQTDQPINDTNPIRDSRSESHDGRSTATRANGAARRGANDSSVVLLSRSVARISDDELQNMSRDDLIEMVRMATPSLPQQGYHRHLPYMSRDQLQQLACLARHSCRLHTGIARDC